MEEFEIQYLSELSQEIADKMERDLVEYESSHGILVNHKRFSLVLINKSGEVFGVLNAYTAFAEIYVDGVWVQKRYRGKGYGRKLIEELESRFKGRGFNNINLVTSAFQAPEFYKKCGFIAEFVRENKKHPKLTKTFFIKYFNEEVETQGILK